MNTIRKERGTPRTPVKQRPGVNYYPDALDQGEQKALMAEIRDVLRLAPLFAPTMPRSGKPLSVRMSNCGQLGWVSDKDGGYRYQRHHPETGTDWPPMPRRLVGLWHELTGYETAPQACLINYYSEGSRMGLHRDDDEQDLDAPIMSISLGDNAWFRLGGLARKQPTSRLMLHSGDIICMQGPARLIYHGIDRILPGTSNLLEEGGRFNLTLRRVTRPGTSAPAAPADTADDK